MIAPLGKTVQSSKVLTLLLIAATIAAAAFLLLNSPDKRSYDLCVQRGKTWIVKDGLCE